MLNVNKKIVIIGGGTAGWITALWVKKNFPNFKVTLVESKEIEIIGVGESTTPNLVELFKELNIPIKEIVKNTKGGIKNGISFENWHGDNTKYFHDFNPINEVYNFNIKDIFTSDCYDYYLKFLINKKINFNKFTYVPKISYENKIDLQNCNFALHFDAALMASYLKSIALKRNINHIYDDFVGVKNCEKNFIKHLIFKNNKKIECDFVFDCSGFARLIIGKYYKSKWNSYSPYLAMKKAIMCPYEYDDKNIWPYTKSTAMKNGWMFEIPLEERVGRGYIFDESFANEEEIIKELEIHTKNKIKVRKIIKFEAGTYENFWIKNAMCIGLSSSFVEPLESTSLFITVGQLQTLKFFLNNLFLCNQNRIDLFNEIMKNNMENVLSFIRLHYITKRKDSKFWVNYEKNYKINKHLQNKLELIKNDIGYFDLELDNLKKTTYFTLSSYLQVCNGLRLFKKLNLKNYEKINPSINKYKKIIEKYSQKAIKLKDWKAGDTNNFLLYNGIEPIKKVKQV